MTAKQHRHNQCVFKELSITHGSEFEFDAKIALLVNLSSVCRPTTNKTYHMPGRITALHQATT